MAEKADATEVVDLAKPKNRPPVRLPRSMRRKSYAITWLLKVTMLTIYHCLFMRVEVMGKDDIPKKGAVGVCGNHRSDIDALIWSVITKRNGAMLAKAELWNSIFTGWLMRMRGDIPVDRGTPAARTLAASTLDWVWACGGLGGWFPAGTTTPRAWQKGMFEKIIAHQIPFMVIWLGGTEQVLPSTKADKAALKATRPKWLRWLPAVNPWAKIRVARVLVTPQDYEGMDAQQLCEYAENLCNSLAYE